MLIDAHSGHTCNFGLSLPPHLRTKSEFSKPRHAHTPTILLPGSTEFDGQHNSPISPGRCRAYECGRSSHPKRLGRFKICRAARRGLTGVQLIISDACRGLMESAVEYLPEARWQRCMVHFYRNVFSHVPATKVREVSHMLKAIHAQESRDAADRKARAIVDDLRAARMNTAADLVERSVSETLTYYAFPDIHWLKIRTNNPLERIMKEIRRRTRVVGAFPDGQSCLNLAAARLRYIAGTAWSAKCYMNMRPLYQPQVTQTEAVA